MPPAPGQPAQSRRAETQRHSPHLQTGRPQPSASRARRPLQGDASGLVSPSTRWGLPMLPKDHFSHPHSAEPVPHLCGLKTGQNSQRRSQTPKPAIQTEKDRCKRAGQACDDPSRCLTPAWAPAWRKRAPRRRDQKGVPESGSASALSVVCLPGNGLRSPLYAANVLGSHQPKGSRLRGHSPPAGMQGPCYHFWKSQPMDWKETQEASICLSMKQL